MSEYAYLLLTTRGEIQTIDYDEPEFDLATIRQAIDCDMIEIVNTRLHTNLVLVIDDCGKLCKNKGINPYATLLYRGILSGDWIAGNAILCVRREYPEPDIYPMSQPAAEAIHHILQDTNWRRLEGTEWR